MFGLPVFRRPRGYPFFPPLEVWPKCVRLIIGLCGWRPLQRWLVFGVDLSLGRPVGEPYVLCKGPSRLDVPVLNPVDVPATLLISASADLVPPLFVTSWPSPFHRVSSSTLVVTLG